MSRPLLVEPYAAAQIDTWDALVRGARARHFMFERRYMEYHSDRFPDASLFVLEGDQPLAAFPASRHDDEVISHGGLTFGGLLAGPRLTTVRAVEALEAVAAALRAHGARRLIYKPVPHIYHAGPAEEDLYALYAAGARLVRRDVSAAVSPAAAVRKASERRRALARARAAGVTVSEDDGIEDFMGLLEEVLAERHETSPVHTPGEMRLLADRFPEEIHLYTATLEGTMLAGVLVYETPVVAHAQYIAASGRGREIGASDAVFDHLLTERYGDRWFDFGTSNERDGTLNQGLIRNKEGFGARAVAYDQYALALT